MKRSLFLISLLLLLPVKCTGYERPVHVILSKNAISISNVEQRLRDNVGILKDTKFKDRSNLGDGITFLDWIGQGSYREDDGTNCFNHFFDPTNGQGLTVSGFAIGEPSVVWGEFFAGNLWRWQMAREYYYLALTNEQIVYRNNDYAYLFTSLGHVLHLVQDKAQPAHVRNDPHLPWLDFTSVTNQRDLYEKYTYDKRKTLNYAGYNAVGNDVFNNFDKFWTDSGRGLADFTNSNFLSRNTNLDDGAYASPVATSEWFTDVIVDTPWGPTTAEVRYKTGYVTDNYRPASSASIQHLTAFSYFDFEMEQLNGENVYSLDDRVHKNYADFLLPRATGYAAGLLNYFFRAEIDPEMVTDYNEIKIANNSSENMTGGSLELYGMDFDCNKELITSWPSFNLSAGTTTDPPLQITPPPGMSEHLTDNLTLVYRGPLGSESDAVVGKIFRNEFEPWDTKSKHDWWQWYWFWGGSFWEAHMNDLDETPTDGYYNDGDYNYMIAPDPENPANNVLKIEYRHSAEVFEFGDFFRMEIITLDWIEENERTYYTDDYPKMRTQFYIQEFPATGRDQFVELHAILKDPATGITDYGYNVGGMQVFAKSCEKTQPHTTPTCAGQWTDAEINLPPGYIIEGVFIELTTSWTDLGENWIFYVNDIVLEHKPFDCPY